PQENYIGLFGYIDSATIKDLKVENVDIEGRNYVGALVGYANNRFYVTNCIAQGVGIVKGSSYVGGLAGTFNNGVVDNCSSKVNVEGASSIVGGLAGSINALEISRCYAEGNVKSIRERVGGLIGYASIRGSNERVRECYALGNAEGSKEVGGLIGIIYGHSMAEMVVEDCFALGDVTANDNFHSYAGGLVGNVIGRKINVQLKNSYCVGKIQSNVKTTTGGLIGDGINNQVIINCCYDGVASGHVPKNQEDISRLTTGMKTQANFTDWDFIGIWNIDEGNSYPYLTNLPKPAKVSQGLPENEVSGGKGTAEEPYIISTKEQLNNLRFQLNGHYKLGNDIDLGNVEWEPIGIQTMAFTGVLDGAGYKISNLKIYKPQENYIGLFGYIDSATIKDLKVENVDIEGRNYVGALVGYANNRFYV
ncbi:MAG: hypothetical protein MJA82_13600, partial [Clostridia bacterium]|nr:hypothetical protein [Clostridia bacterium]